VFASGFPRSRGVNRLTDHLAAHRGVLIEILAELVVHELRHVAGDIAVQLSLGLPFELRLRNLYADDRGETLANVIAGQVLLDILEQALLLAEGVDGAGQRGAEPGKVR